MYKLAVAMTLFAASAAHAEVQELNLSSWNHNGEVHFSNPGEAESAKLTSYGFDTSSYGGTNGAELFSAAQTFTAGSTLSFNWLFTAGDSIYKEYGDNGNDFAEFLIDDQVFRLSNVATAGNLSTSSGTFSYTFTQDSTPFLRFIVSNYGDTYGNSQLEISSLNVAAVPEPETYALMAVGLLGLLAARKRKQAA